MIADMAQNIAGDKVEIECLLPIGGDPHIYEPTPRDAQKVAAADLILMNGLTLEGWMKELIDNSGTKAKMVTVTEGVQALVSEQHQGSADPHAWMTAANGIIYSQNILNALIDIYPESPASNAFFKDNFLKYKNQLDSLDNYIKNVISQIPEKQRVLITSHDAFHYFGLRYGLRLESVLGTSTDADVQTSDIIRLVKIIKETSVPAVFIESTINPKLLNQLAQDNKIIIGGKLYADSLGDSTTPASNYIGLLRHDATVIAQSLSQEKSQLAVPTEGGNSFGLTLSFIGFVALCGIVIYLISKKRV
jgi:ABC-type Zn uptake system ZnuABC Zn-binding protein ZnuA